MNIDLAATDENQFFPLVALSSSIFPLFLPKIYSFLKLKIKLLRELNVGKGKLGT